MRRIDEEGCLTRWKGAWGVHDPFLGACDHSIPGGGCIGVLVESGA